MPVKDKYHDLVITALQKEEWQIVSEHYFLPIGKKKSYVDIAADKPIAATKGDEKILVEIKSFVGKSEMVELEKALGQFSLYVVALEIVEPDRELFLAIPEEIYLDLFLDAIIQKVLQRNQIKLFTFDVLNETIVRWIK